MGRHHDAINLKYDTMFNKIININSGRLITFAGRPSTLKVDFEMLSCDEMLNCLDSIKSNDELPH